MTLHNDLTRVIEDARDHSRKNFNVEKESYGQYLARAILASDVIAQVRAEAIRSARDELGVYVGDEDSDWWDGYRNGQRRQNTVLAEYADRIEREAGTK